MKAYYENRTYDSEIPVSAFTVKDLNFVAHWHTEIEMIFVCEGQIGAGINSAYKVLQKGDISICGSNDIHYYNSEAMSSTSILIIFRSEVLNAFKYWHEDIYPRSVFIDQDSFVKEASGDLQVCLNMIFNQILNEIAQKKNMYSQFTDLRIFELFLTLFRSFPDYYADSKSNPAGSNAPAYIKPMQIALQYLEENYAQDITLEQISKHANLSRFYFSRLFRKATGMNFNIYLNRIRVDNSEILIKNTRKPIIEIAYETGFSSIRTFNRSYKTIKGCTPMSQRHNKTSPCFIKKISGASNPARF